MMATVGSSDIGAVNTTCSCLKDFLRSDFREVPYDDFLGFRKVGFCPCMGAAFLGLGFDLEPETRVRFSALGSVSKKVAMALQFGGKAL